MHAVSIYRLETYLIFVILKCHVCLSFVIKMRKMTKLWQKLQNWSLQRHSRATLLSSKIEQRARIIGEIFAPWHLTIAITCL